MDAKFADQAQDVISEFLFCRWLLKALCDEGHVNGLIKKELVVHETDLWNNLQLTKDALVSLVSTNEDESHLLPKPIAVVCKDRRRQAIKFKHDFFAQELPYMAAENYNPKVYVDTFVASWKDICIIYDFFKGVVQEVKKLNTAWLGQSGFHAGLIQLGEQLID